MEVKTGRKYRPVQGQNPAIFPMARFRGMPVLVAAWGIVPKIVPILVAFFICYISILSQIQGKLDFVMFFALGKVHPDAGLYASDSVYYALRLSHPALPQRPCRGLHPGGNMGFRVARCPADPLTEVLQFFQR